MLHDGNASSVRVCQIVQNSEEGGLEKLINLEVNRSLLIFFFSREKFQKIVNSRGRWSG